MIESLYIGVGLIVALTGLIILIKIEPPWDKGERPSFGEFLAVIGICLMMLIMGTMFWPVLFVVGGIYLLWRALYHEKEDSSGF